jgi:hypothetical protein
MITIHHDRSYSHRVAIAVDGKVQTSARGATLADAVREAVRQFRIARADRKRG